MPEDLKPGIERKHGRFVRTSVELAFFIALLCSSGLFALTSPPNPRSDDTSESDGIMAVQENGKTIYVNAPAEQVPRTTESTRDHARRTSVLVYWSSREKRWKPVQPPSPTAMRAAQTAAAEVADYVGSRPASATATSKPTVRKSNPNYRDLARGRAVSTVEIDSAIEQAAKRHGVDGNLVRGIIKAESNFNPRAVSRKGAMGLMQLMPGTARSLNVSNPFDPNQNVDAGVRYFKGLMTSYRGDVKLSLAAYNAGAGAVARSNGVPPFRETQNYVKQITDIYWNGKQGETANPTIKQATTPTRTFRDASGRLVMTSEE